MLHLKLDYFFGYVFTGKEGILNKMGFADKIVVTQTIKNGLNIA